MPATGGARPRRRALARAQRVQRRRGQLRRCATNAPSVSGVPDGISDATGDSLPMRPRGEFGQYGAPPRPRPVSLTAATRSARRRQQKAGGRYHDHAVARRDRPRGSGSSAGASLPAENAPVNGAGVPGGRLSTSGRSRRCPRYCRRSSAPTSMYRCAGFDVGVRSLVVLTTGCNGQFERGTTARAPVGRQRCRPVRRIDAIADQRRCRTRPERRVRREHPATRAIGMRQTVYCEIGMVASSKRARAPLGSSWPYGVSASPRDGGARGHAAFVHVRGVGVAISLGMRRRAARTVAPGGGRDAVADARAQEHPACHRPAGASRWAKTFCRFVPKPSVKPPCIRERSSRSFLDVGLLDVITRRLRPVQ